jgi:hypothetical protein
MTASHARRRLSRRWWVPPLAVGAGLVAAAGWGIAAHQPRLPRAGPSPVLAGRQAAAAVQIPQPAAGRDIRHGHSPAEEPAMPAVLPVGAKSVTIPSLGVTAAATPETVKAGQLGVPADPARVGWWMPSTAELVIDGHVDTAAAGPGALYRTGSLSPGAAITVRTADGSEHWTVDGVRTYVKGQVPAGLFAGYGPRLVIITCGGPFDYVTRHYDDNVIAYASPASR